MNIPSIHFLVWKTIWLVERVSEYKFYFTGKRFSSPPGINLLNSVFNKKHFLKFGNVLEHYNMFRME